jgi:hypothetical protein
MHGCSSFQMPKTYIFIQLQTLYGIKAENTAHRMPCDIGRVMPCLIVNKSSKVHIYIKHKENAHKSLYITRHRIQKLFSYILIPISCILVQNCLWHLLFTAGRRVRISLRKKRNV